jgi:hypothetical protein
MTLVYTITLPDEGKEATLLAQKGGLAHLARFRWRADDDLLLALRHAQSELEALEAHPPQLEAPAEKLDTPKPNDKPKRKKRSLDDLPDDEPAPRPRRMFEPVATATAPTTTARPTVQAGATLPLSAGLRDVDGDALAFVRGRVVEIDDDSPARVWLESLDGEQDAWVLLADLEATLH